jgi:hypothetical protein
MAKGRIKVIIDIGLDTQKKHLFRLYGYVEEDGYIRFNIDHELYQMAPNKRLLADSYERTRRALRGVREMEKEKIVISKVRSGSLDDGVFVPRNDLIRVLPSGVKNKDDDFVFRRDRLISVKKCDWVVDAVDILMGRISEQQRMKKEYHNRYARDDSRHFVVPVVEEGAVIGYLKIENE